MSTPSHTDIATATHYIVLHTYLKDGGGQFCLLLVHLRPPAVNRKRLSLLSLPQYCQLTIRCYIDDDDEADNGDNNDIDDNADNGDNDDIDDNADNGDNDDIDDNADNGDKYASDTPRRPSLSVKPYYIHNSGVHTVLKDTYSSNNIPTAPRASVGVLSQLRGLPRVKMHHL